MLPKDTRYQDPYADMNEEEDQSVDPTQPAPLNPTVAAYLQGKKDAQAARDAGNQQGQTQDMMGAGVDVASALFNRPSKQAVFLQHYNDSSAPKLTQGYEPKANGDALRAEADKSRAAGVAKGAQISKDFEDKNRVDNQVRQQGREDVQDTQTATKFDQNNQEFAHKQSRQPGDDAFTDAQRGDATAGFATNAEHRDPNSAASKGLRASIAAGSPAFGKAVEGQSYEDIAKGPYASLINAYEARKGREEAATGRHQDKKAKDQGDAYLHMRKDLESFRGNAAAQQASKDVLSAEKTLAMVKSKPPEKFTTQDLSLLAGEMAKIATGGVPTEHGIQTLMPNNLSTKFAEMQNFLSSKPTDAQAGAYIRANMKYVEEMQDTAKNTLKSYRGNLAKGYKSKVRPEDYEEAANDYGFGDSAAPSGGAPNAPATSAPMHGADLP